jgi:hypothetical protein
VIITALALGSTAALAQAPNKTDSNAPQAADTAKSGPKPAQMEHGKMAPGAESKSSGNASMQAPSMPVTGKNDTAGDQTKGKMMAPTQASGPKSGNTTVGSGSSDPATRGKDNDKQNKAQ